MLKISVNGEELDLRPDIQINLTIENPFMAIESVPTPYSLSFDLPPTPKNLRIFNFPNRLGAYKKEGQLVSELPCVISFSAISIARGTLKVSNFDKSIKANFKGVEITERIRSEIYSTPMDQFDFIGGNYDNPNFNSPTDYSYKYKQMAIDASKGLNNKFVVAPIRIKTENEPIDFISRTNRSGEIDGTSMMVRQTASMMDSEYFNFYNAERKEFTLIKEDPPSGISPVAHASIFPFIRLHYLFEKLFGDILINNIFSQSELKDLVIPSTFFNNWSPRNNAFRTNKQRGMMFNNNPPFVDNPIYPPGTTITPYFLLNSFLPNVLASDIIKQSLNLFCASLVAIKGKFEMRFNKDIIAKPVQASWDEKLIEDLGISIQEKKAYKYGYEDDREYKPDEYVTKVNSIFEMVNTNDFPVLDGKNDKVYQILSTGQFFQKESTTVVVENKPKRYYTVYKLLDNGIGNHSETQGAVHNAISQIKPLPMYPEEYWWTEKVILEQTRPGQEAPEVVPEKAWWFVPRWEGDRSLREEAAYIMFYRGASGTPKAGHSYPYLTPFDKDPSGESIGSVSLAWNGSNGLINKFHKTYKEWIEKEKVKVSATLKLQPLDLHNLDITDKVHLKGRNFFIEKIQITIRHNRLDPAVVDFIEA